MAWSPQARAAAIAARRAHAHGPMIKMNGHHGRPGKKVQPVNPNAHKGQKIAPHGVGAAYKAGLSLGQSQKLLKKAGLHPSQSKQQQIRKVRRVAAYTTGVYTTSLAAGAVAGGATYAAQVHGPKASRAVKRGIARGSVKANRAGSKIKYAKSNRQFNKMMKHY